MTPVNIIVPVYRGLKDVQDCLESVYASTNNTPYEIIVIDDCSPEPAISAYLKEESKKNTFTLLINEENLGFVATVNRGMQLHPERDVLLLNSDTVVANDWLDRLVACAYSSDNVGTVTPFSNNATICSYPDFCQDNEFPKNCTVAELDTLFSSCNAGESIDIPTGVGFCMYIRRACLNIVGYFDVETFGKGYGEENDFCQRTIQLGWTNKFALDTFVLHTGNVSFGDEHNDLKHTALDKLSIKHPTYNQQVQQHIIEDNAKPFRKRVWLASLRYSQKPITIHLSHNRGGGTFRFIKELSDELITQTHSLILKASTTKPDHLVLSQTQSNNIDLNSEDHEYCLFFHVEHDKEDLINLLMALPVCILHFHHLIGLPNWIKSLGQTLRLPWYVSIHDYYMVCPQISLTDENDSYCEEKGIESCNTCLKHRPTAGNTNIISWRENFTHFLDNAALCIAPSEDTKKRFSNYFPNAKCITIYHQKGKYTGNEPAPLTIKPKQKNKTLNVLVIGALSKMKGADLLEEVAIYCKKQELNIRFTLTGYAYRNLITSPDSNLEVEGQYRDDTLLSTINNKILNDNVDIIWFTSVIPETFSYTLSSAIQSGLPILAPDIGAFPERLHARQHAWVLPWNSDVTTFANLFIKIQQSLQNNPSESILSNLESKIPFVDTSYQYEGIYLKSAKAIDLTPIKHHTKNEINQWASSILGFSSLKKTETSKVRSTLLKLLYNLRSRKTLQPLVRCIPNTLQRRIKEKLAK